MSASLLHELMQALQVLPGVGKRTAQRMAFHILQREPDAARNLAAVLGRALDQIRQCERCRTLTEHPLCAICSADNRNPELLCVVETPAEQMSIEELGQYNGYYFVLHGRLSPLDRIGPKEIGVEQLLARVAELGVREVILATNFTLEGEATAGYLGQRLRERGVSSSRLAHGVPSGGELEYIDHGTLARAIAERRLLPDTPGNAGSADTGNSTTNNSATSNSDTNNSDNSARDTGNASTRNSVTKNHAANNSTNNNSESDNFAASSSDSASRNPSSPAANSTAGE